MPKLRRNNEVKKERVLDVEDESPNRTKMMEKETVDTSPIHTLKHHLESPLVINTDSSSYFSVPDISQSSSFSQQASQEMSKESNINVRDKGDIEIVEEEDDDDDDDDYNDDNECEKNSTGDAENGSQGLIFDDEEEVDKQHKSFNEMDSFIVDNDDDDDDKNEDYDSNHGEEGSLRKEKHSQNRSTDEKNKSLPDLEKIKTLLLQIIKQLGDRVNHSNKEVYFQCKSNCVSYLKQLRVLLQRDYTMTRQVWKQLNEWELLQLELLPLLSTYRDYNEEIAFEVMKLLCLMTKPIPTERVLESSNRSNDNEEDQEENVNRDDSKVNIEKKRPKKNTKLSNSITDPVNYGIQLSMLQNIKKAFIDKKDAIFAIIGSLGSSDESKYFLFQKKEQKGRLVIDYYSDEYIYHIITLFVNLLSIPDPDKTQAISLNISSSWINMHEQLIYLLKESSVLNFIFALIQELLQSKERMKQTVEVRRWRMKWSFLLLDLICLILKYESPTQIFISTIAEELEEQQQQQHPVTKATKKVSRPTANQHTLSLLSELLNEEKKQQSMIKQNIPQRHSRFGGTFFLNSSESKDGQDSVLVHSNDLFKKGWQKIQQFTNEKMSFSRKKLKFREYEHVDAIGSMYQTKTIVKWFGRELLEYFNQFTEMLWHEEEMQSAVFAVLSSASYDESENTNAGINIKDINNLLSFTKFALEYNRCLQQIELKRVLNTSTSSFLISTTTRFSILKIISILQEPFLQFILTFLESHVDRKEWMNMVHGISCLKEIILTLELVITVNELNYEMLDQRRKGINLMKHLMYFPKYSQIVIALIKSHDPSKVPIRYLVDLIEYSHVFIRICTSWSSIDMNVKQEGEEKIEFNEFKLLEQFARNKVTKQYFYLLQRYTSNQWKWNHYIIKMLQKICKECDREPLLFQISFFVAAQKILNDPDVKKLLLKVRESESLEDSLKITDEDEQKMITLGSFFVLNNEKQYVDYKQKFMLEMAQFCNTIIQKFYLSWKRKGIKMGLPAIRCLGKRNLASISLLSFERGEATGGHETDDDDDDFHISHDIANSDEMKDFIVDEKKVKIKQENIVGKKRKRGEEPNYDSDEAEYVFGEESE